MSTKRINPYQRLLGVARQYACDVKHCTRKTMFAIKKDDLSAGYSMRDVYERTKAADQLGYDVVVIAGDELTFQYRKRVDVPWELR